MIRNKTLRTLGLYPAGFSRSASGAAASFRTDLAAPLRDLTVGISPVQSGSGDPSPDNVRPISGWTGANIVVSPTLEAADGTTYPVSWQAEAGTVYGGTLDVLSGKLRVTHGLSIQPVSQETVSAVLVRTGGNTTFWIYAGTAFLTYATQEDAICNIAKVNASATGTSQLQRNEFGFSGAYLNSYYMSLATDLVGTTQSSVYDYLSTHKVEMWLKLANPIEYTLSPTQISSLAGENNIWADTGDVALSYREGGIGSRSWMLALLAGRRNA